MANDPELFLSKTGYRKVTAGTNANLTGPITSIGNATTVSSSINLPGSPTTTTQSLSDDSTKVATTAFVKLATAITHNFSRAQYVSKGGNDSTGNGSAMYPFLTIQAALNTIGNSTTAADVKKPQAVIIDGGAYDENLTIPKGRLISLIGISTIILGDGAGTAFASTTPRSITFTANNADVFGSDIKPTLNINVIGWCDGTSTFMAESGCFFISGNLNVAGDGLTHSINLSNTKLFGTITKTAAGLTNLQVYKSLFIGAINMATATILERAYNSEFDALVTVDGYNEVTNCEFKAGMTVTTNFNTLPPSGFFNTTFTGTFTGPANSLKLDLASDYFFTTNGAALAGGATKVLLEQPASATSTGVITTGTQTIAGNKTFSGTLSTASIGKTGGVQYILPAADGTSGQKLTTDGAGNLSWT